jgi:hypothetical protein
MGFCILTVPSIPVFSMVFCIFALSLVVDISIFGPPLDKPLAFFFWIKAAQYLAPRRNLGSLPRPIPTLALKNPRSLSPMVLQRLSFHLLVVSNVIIGCGFGFALATAGFEPVFRRALSSERSKWLLNLTDATGFGGGIDGFH